MAGLTPRLPAACEGVAGRAVLRSGGLGRRARLTIALLFLAAVYLLPLLATPPDSQPQYARQLYWSALAAALLLVFRRRQGILRRLMPLLFAFLAAAVLMVWLYLRLIGQRYPTNCPPVLGLIQFDTLLIQTLLFSGLGVILGGLDWLAKHGLRRLLGLAGAGPPAGRAVRWRQAVVIAGRVAMFWLIGLPWGMVFVQAHRPKLNYPERPMSAFSELPRDSALPAGWVVPADGPSDVAVLISHGRARDQGVMVRFIELFHNLGCHVVSFDMPGHGQSPGCRTTCGWQESFKVQRVANWVRASMANGQARLPGLPSTHGQPRRLIGFGGSMGGMAMLLAAEREPKLFDGLILDSCFPTLDGVARHQLQRVPAVLRWPVFLVGPPLVAWEMGARMSRADVTRDMARLDGIPKLFFHCRTDVLVPFEQGEALYRAAGEPKRFVAFDSGTHLAGLAVEYPRYQSEVRRFVEALAADGH